MNSATKIRMTERTYSRTESGKSWKSRPDETTEKIYNEQQYDNMTNADTRRFFKRLGGSESVVRGYTREGYIITELISCNPGRTIRKIRNFKIEEE